MKRITKALAVAMSVAAFAGSAYAADKVYKVAYIARTQSDSFASWLLDSAKIVVKKYPDMKMDFFDGQNDNEKIRTHMENAITNKYNMNRAQRRQEGKKNKHGKNGAVVTPIGNASGRDNS